MERGGGSSTSQYFTDWQRNPYAFPLANSLCIGGNPYGSSLKVYRLTDGENCLIDGTLEDVFGIPEDAWSETQTFDSLESPTFMHYGNVSALQTDFPELYNNLRNLPVEAYFPPDPYSFIIRILTEDGYFYTTCTQAK